MPDRDVVEAFIATVVEGKFDLAIERYYAPEASMQENVGRMRKGRDVLVAAERAVMQSFKEIRALCVRPVFVDGDHAVVRWIFEFVTADGQVRKLDELAHQRWENGKIAEERFYYDPAQLTA